MAAWLTRLVAETEDDEGARPESLADEGLRVDGRQASFSPEPSERVRVCQYWRSLITRRLNPGQSRVRHSEAGDPTVAFAHRLSEKNSQRCRTRFKGRTLVRLFNSFSATPSDCALLVRPPVLRTMCRGRGIDKSRVSWRRKLNE